MHQLTKFDYEKLENPELTDDHPVFAALYNPTSLSFITAAGKDVKIWDARTGKLLRVYRCVLYLRTTPAVGAFDAVVLLADYVLDRGLSSSDLTALCLDFRERKLVVGNHGTLLLAVVLIICPSHSDWRPNDWLARLQTATCTCSTI